MAAGIIILVIFLNHPNFSTRATLIKSRSVVETPKEVLTRVGHKEQSATVIAEFKKESSNIGSSETTNDPTTIITIGNQARGETGLRSELKDLLH